VTLWMEIDMPSRLEQKSQLLSQLIFVFKVRLSPWQDSILSFATWAKSKEVE